MSTTTPAILRSHRPRPHRHRSPPQPLAERALRARDSFRERREHRGERRARRLLRREDRALAEGQARRQESRLGERHLVGTGEHPVRRAHLPNQPPARARLPQHARAALLLRRLRGLGPEVSHQGPRHLLAAVSRALHAHDAHPPDAARNSRASATPDFVIYQRGRISRPIASRPAWARRRASTSASRTRNSSSSAPNTPAR